MLSRLNQAQWDLLVRTIGELRLLPTCGDGLMELLRLATRAIPASLGRYSAIDPATYECFGVNTHVLSTGGKDLDDLAPEVLPDCPVLQSMLGPMAPAVIRSGEQFGLRQFWNTASWDVYYRPAGSRFTLSARLSPPGFSPLVSIDLDRDRCDFTGEESLLLELLRPHLREAYERICAAERRRRTGLDTGRGTAVLLLDRDLRPMRGASVQPLHTPAPEALHSLPRSMAEVAWLHYGSFCRESLAGSNWSLKRTAQGESSLEVLGMDWETDSGQTRVTRRMDGSRAAAPSVPPPLNALRTLGLTPREAEVLFWVSEGKGNEVIGRLLGVSPRTIQKHLETVHRKLGVENRTAAAAVALRHLLGAQDTGRIDNQ